MKLYFFIYKLSGLFSLCKNYEFKFLHDLTEDDLAFRFEISQSTVSRYISKNGLTLSINVLVVA